MAKQTVDIQALSASIVNDAKAGVFKPVYLLQGDEPYYPELICQAIIDNCLQEWEKDFNETICFGADVTAGQVITAARRYPMMADRQLIVVKEAQLMADIESLAVYCAEPLDSTVLVVLLHGASVDKRKAFYKSVQKCGVVVDSAALRDYEVPSWIINHYHSRGLSIDPQSAALLAESTGPDLGTIMAETDKMLKNLPESCRTITAEDIEKNVGISRQFSVFELTKELSYRNAPKALKIAANMSSAAKFQMPAAVSALYLHFNRIMRYGALLASDRNPGPDQKARALAGVNPYFYKEYDAAVRNYPLPRAQAVISLLAEYDYLCKGGDGGSLPADQLMVELVARVLNS